MTALLQGPMPPLPPIPFELVMIAKSFFITIAAIALGIPIIRALSRRFIERAPVAPALPNDLLMRLERIEQAVDSIAIEVERVSEGQRYTTRLLSEQRQTLGSGGIPGGPAGGSTPPAR
jgi:hypothetical protein